MNREEAINDLKTIKVFFEERGGAFPVSIEYAIDVLGRMVLCEECRDCVEKGAGADCPSGYGYLYCTRKKSVVNEDDYCSWGERR